MQAALGLSQLERIDEFADRRRENFRYLYAALEEVQGLILPRATAKSDPSWFGFPITLDPKHPVDREELLRFLDSRKIGTRLMFAGNIVRQPAYKDVQFRIASSLEMADVVMRRTFWVGTYPGLTPPMLDYIAASIAEFMSQGTLMRYLVTGHTGFKGSWLSLWLAEQGHEVHGVALDPLPGALFEAADVARAMARDVRLDIRDAPALASLIRETQPDVVMHLAAQPLVRESYRDPRDNVLDERGRHDERARRDAGSGLDQGRRDRDDRQGLPKRQPDLGLPRDGRAGRR